MNPKFTQIFGYKSDEIIDKLSPLDLTHPEDKDLVGGNLNKRFEEKENEMQYVFRGKCKDGKTIYCESLGRKLEYRGQPAIIGTLLDISERKQMENDLKKYTDHLEEEISKRSQELVQSEKMAAIGQLIAGIMHEINNPLAFLQGNTQMMQEQIKPIKEAVLASSPDKKIKAEPLMEMMESMMSENLEGTNRIREIAMTLKNFAKPDQSQAELSDLNKGIKDTLMT